MRRRIMGLSDHDPAATMAVPVPQHSNASHIMVADGAPVSHDRRT
jgi:hypothetical protein